MATEAKQSGTVEKAANIIGGAELLLGLAFVSSLLIFLGGAKLVVGHEIKSRRLKTQ